MKLYHESRGSGPPLILIAGFTSNLHVWDLHVEVLAQHFQVVRFDNRGVGRSPSPEASFTLEEMADDVANLMDTLNIERASLIGASMGSAISQIFAYRYPTRVDKLILTSAFPKSNSVAVYLFETLLKMFEAGISYALIKKCLMPWCCTQKFFDNTAAINKVNQLIDDEPYPQSFIGFKNQLLALENFDSTPFLSKIGQPTCIIGAGSDILTPPSDSEILAKHIPNSELHIIPDVGHAISLENPPDFQKILLKFLM